MWKAFCGYFQINLHIHSMQVFCQLIYITKLYRCLITLLVVVTLSFGTLKSNWITDSGITISESESEIHNQKYHTSINWDKHWFLYMCSEEMEFNKINEWSEKLSAQRKRQTLDQK